MAAIVAVRRTPTHLEEGTEDAGVERVGHALELAVHCLRQRPPRAWNGCV